MKKMLVVMISIGLVAASLAGTAEAKKKKPPAPERVERIEELAYNFGSPGVPGAVGVCLSVLVPEAGSACLDVPTGAEEAYVAVDVADASGQKPYGILAQDTDGDGIFNIFAEFCGATEAPVAITPGLVLRVSLYAGPSSTCAGVATTGNITAVLSNLL